MKMKYSLNCGLLVACLMLIAGASTAQAATFSVTNLNDNGAGSLRQAVLDANSNPDDSIIDFAPGLAGTINLAGVLPNLSTNIDIQGPGSDALTVRRDSGYFRIFKISNGMGTGPKVTLSGLTITNGSDSHIGNRFTPRREYSGAVVERNQRCHRA